MNRIAPRLALAPTRSVPLYQQVDIEDVDPTLEGEVGIRKLDWDIIYIVQDGDYISEDFVIPADCRKMEWNWYVEDTGSISIYLVDSVTGSDRLIDLAYATSWRDNNGTTAEYVSAGAYYLEVSGPWDGWQISAHCLDRGWYE